MAEDDKFQCTNCNLDKSLSQRCILFEQIFNKSITKAYLSKLNKNAI